MKKLNRMLLYLIKIELTLILLLATLGTPIVNALLFPGHVDYVTPSLGVVHFSRDFYARQYDTWGGLIRFQDLQWNGKHRGTLAVDVFNGGTITFTSLQASQLTYDVISPGGNNQTIYYQGDIGGVKQVNGGTYTVSGDFVTVDTLGNSTVTIMWDHSVTELNNDIMGYFSVFATLPLLLAGGLIVAGATGNIDGEAAMQIIKLIVGLLFGLLILGVLLG